jgi:hypothetical protein
LKQEVVLFLATDGILLCNTLINRRFLSKFAENILRDTDMSTSTPDSQTAKRMYRKIHRLPPEAQLELSEYIEFLSRKYQTGQAPRRFFGCMKGLVTWMSDDFNDPVDDFKEYM